MKIRIKKTNNCTVLFWIINTLLVFNMAKIYDLNMANDTIRLICYALLAIYFPLTIATSLIEDNFILRDRGFAIALLAYIFILMGRLVYGGDFKWDNWLNCFLVPCVMVECYLGMRNSKVSKIIFWEKIVTWIVIALFMYNKLFLRQSGAGKLNSIFYVLLLLPIVLCIPEAIDRNILLLAISVCTIFSMKRTAVVLLAIGVGIFQIFQNKDNRNKFIKIGVAAIVFLAITIWIQDHFNISILEKFKNVTEDGGSGRSEIYTVLLERFFKRSMGEIMFGGGYYGVINIIGGSAHNDFLEVAYDFGLIGLLAYLTIYVNLIKQNVKMWKCRYRYAVQFSISIACFFVMSMLSHVIMIPTYILHCAIFWGCILNHFRNSLKSMDR